MTFDALTVFAPIIGLSVNVLTQIAYFRLRKDRGLLRSVFFGFFCGLAATFLWDVLNLASADLGAKEWIAALAVNQVIAGALGYCYFHFVNLGETARRIRILRELCSRPEGLTREKLLARYNARDMIDKRFARLLRNGQILEVGGRFVVKRGMVYWITLVMSWAKRLIMGKSWAAPR